MTRKQNTTSVIDVKALLEGDGDYLRAMVRAVVEATLEAEMTAVLGAEKGERSEARPGYRSGRYGRSLTTRVGVLELRVPQDRDGRFSPRLFERCQRSESEPANATGPREQANAGGGPGGDVRARVRRIGKRSGGPFSRRTDAEGQGDHRG